MLRVLYVALTENDTVRGVERYALELVGSLAKKHGHEVRITLLCGEWQRYFEVLKASGVELMIAPVRNSKRSRHLFLWSRMHALSADFDLVHYGNLFPISRANAVPSTMTIPDVAEYALAGKYGRAQRLYRKLVGWRAARSIAAIAADSHFTRDEIVREGVVHGHVQVREAEQEQARRADDGRLIPVGAEDQIERRYHLKQPHEQVHRDHRSASDEPAQRQPVDEQDCAYVEKANSTHEPPHSLVSDESSGWCEVSVEDDRGAGQGC